MVTINKKPTKKNSKPINTLPSIKYATILYILMPVAFLANS